MKLPPDKTCSDCVHFARCARLVGAKETWTTCDWSPSRFQAICREGPRAPEAASTPEVQ